MTTFDAVTKTACLALIQDPAAADGCERSHSPAGSVVATQCDTPRWRAEQAVRDARRLLAANPNLKRDLRAALT